MRKILQKSISTGAPSVTGYLDVAAIATVTLTSEATDHPIENAFDDRHGPGASRWIAGMPGEQILVLSFDAPQNISKVILEVEETEVTCTQELTLSVSFDGGNTYRDLRCQEFNFSPPDTTFEREEWSVELSAITHLKVRIKPDKGGRHRLAGITSMMLC